MNMQFYQSIKSRLSLRNKGIGFRLGLLVLFMGIVMSIYCIAGLYMLSDSEKGLKHLFAKRMAPIEQVSKIQRKTIQVRMMLLSAMVHLQEGGDVKPELETIRKIIAEINTIWLTVKNSAVTENEKNLLTNYNDARQSLGAEGVFPMIAALQAGDFDEAALVESVTGDAYEKVETAINKIVISMQNSARHELEESIDKNSLARKLAKISIPVGFLAALLFSLAIIRSVTQPLKRAVKVANRVASGDLTDDIRSESKDEIAQLLNALGGMSTKLREIVSEVQDRITNIENDSNAVAMNNNGLAQVTHQQTASLLQTSRAMENLVVTNSSTTNSSDEAARLSEIARSDTEKGDSVVQQTTSAMSRINLSSGKISDIISTIDTISFQTNLLALNAAVEAARAGEQGRGFAVVAGEVRNLAQNSADAAKEIKTLIENSVEEIKSGTDLVNQSGEMFSELREHIKNVSDIVGNINHAGDYQTTVINEINAAVSELSDACKNNISVAEKSATSSASVAAQIKNLNELMSFFKLEKSEQVAAKEVTIANESNNDEPKAETVSEEADNGMTHEEEFNEHSLVNQN